MHGINHDRRPFAPFYFPFLAGLSLQAFTKMPLLQVQDQISHFIDCLPPLCLSQVQVMQIEQETMEISSQQDLEHKLIGLQNEVQVQIYFLPTRSFFHPQNHLCIVKQYQSSPCVVVTAFVLQQCIKHAMSCLEEQQDEFDFKYQTFKLEGRHLWFRFNLGTTLPEDY